MGIRCNLNKERLAPRSKLGRADRPDDALENVAALA